MYPWKQWMARRRILLVRGRDFRCSAHGLIQQFRNRVQADRLPLRVRAQVLEDGSVRINLDPREDA